MIYIPYIWEILNSKIFLFRKAVKNNNCPVSDNN